MKTSDTIKELLGNYPRLWEFIDAKSPHIEGSTRFARRYPLSISILNTALEFNKWTHQTTHLVSEVTKSKRPENIRKSSAGPDPLVIARLMWLTKIWEELERVDKSLAKTLTSEVNSWTYKIQYKFQGANPYKYLSGATCQSCNTKSVVRYENKLMCINDLCRDPMTGEWKTWEM